MILVGRNLSPFVRRVAATLNLYGLPFEQLPLRATDQGAEIARYNPLGRVPSLVLDDGEILVDSSAIIDHLDSLVGPDRALTPASGPERRAVLNCLALGLGALERIVAAFYERDRRPAERVWPENVTRLAGHAFGGLAALDGMAVQGWLVGGRMTQADVTAAIALDFAEHAMPELVAGRLPALAALRDQTNARPEVGSTRWAG
ncbi:MAG TPA: glutathione S-transferase family protein [Acetobacteraceae bacterium]|jgi:glutathione S-transferase|nr:glutathione S-transferase family protein [Acetobacteraceae bacterium]